MFRRPAEPYLRSCSECGEVMPRDDLDGHVCDRERWLDYELARQRPSLQAFDAELADWLQSAHGRFAVFYAARGRG